MNYFKSFKITFSFSLALVLTASPLLAQQRRNTAPKKPAPPPQVAEPVPTFDSLLAADSYKVYSEVRNVGGLIHSPSINDLIDPVMKLGKPPQEFQTLLKWLNAHADALSGSRMFAASWSSRPNLPAVLIAVEFSSPEEAKKFYPNLRDFLPTLLPTPSPDALHSSDQRSAVRIGIRSADGTLTTEPESVQIITPSATPGAEVQNQPAPPFHLKQTGSVVLIAPTPFEVRDLKPRGSLALEEDLNFALARNRFASEAVFVYIDLKSIEKEEKAQRKKWEQEEQKRIEAEAANPPKPEEPLESTPEMMASPVEPMPPPPAVDTPPPPVPAPDVVTADAQSSTTATLGAGPPDGPGPSFLPIYGALFGGGTTKWPEALGAALVFEGDSYVVRTLIINGAENKNNAIPFLPLFVPGPAIVPESPNVFPANTDLFVSVSLDYPQIYEEMLKAIADSDAVARRYSRRAAREGPPPESPFAYYEKKWGLKIKDDVLPLFGNEIALALPKRPKVAPGEPVASTPEKVEPKPTRPPEPIPVIAISVKDREGVKRLIPKLIEAMGFKGADLLAHTEKRDGTELTSYAGAFAYAFIDNFLVLSTDAAETRRVVDAYLSRETLASDSHFKNFTRWQPRQVLGQVYIAPGLVEQYTFGAARGSAQVSDQTAEFFNRVSPVIDPMTYSLTNDGQGPLHELHVPKNLVQLLVAGASSSANPSPIQANEATAKMALYSLLATEGSTKRNDGRYRTLEELIAENQIPKSMIEDHGYKIIVTLSDNKFEAVAVPLEYGKTCKFSYFIDESGVLRGGDHGGGAATASDPAVD